MPKIHLLRTGIPGLDTVLGGGLPEGSFNVLGGDPGAGKTTLAHQFIFENISEGRPALFCTVVGEPPMKMLRYQQQFSFFDVEQVGTGLHYLNLAEEVLDGDLDGVFDALTDAVERIEPAFIFVDSFRSVAGLDDDPDPSPHRNRLQGFVQRLSSMLTCWEATSFLLGEFDDRETSTNPIFTVADGVFWMQHAEQFDTRIRKLSVSKLRGAEELPGRHVYRITQDGIRVFPRKLEELPPAERKTGSERVSSGVSGLDGMMMGGFVRGDAAMVSGPTGGGKSVLGLHFVQSGLEAGESAVIATFEESYEKYLDRAAQMGTDIGDAIEKGLVEVLHHRPLDLSIDETFTGIQLAVERTGAKRVVVDSLSGLMVAASGIQAERMRESIGRLVHSLTEAGITVLLIAELNQRVDQLRFTPHDSSFLADDVILMRYVELRGELQTVMAVVKMRRSAHSRSFRRYRIAADGIHVGSALEEFRGILTGVPTVTGQPTRDLVGGESTAEGDTE